MACGCAVIAADCPSGPAEIIRHNVDGLLVPSEDVGALADAMGRLIKDEDLRFRLGQQALAVRSLFSQAQIMAQWENLIEDVCLSRK